MRNKTAIKIYQILILAIFIIFWELSVRNSDKLKFLFGSPSLIFISFIDSWINGRIFIDVLFTLSETVIGFIIGNILGVIFGLTLVYFPVLANISKPYVIALGAIPIFALAPMMIIWFGTGFMSKVLMAVFSTFLITTLQAYSGAQSVDKKYERLFKSLNAKKRDFFIIVRIPNSLVWVLTSLRITIGFALLGAFIGEFISSERGLGHLILKAGGLYNIPLVLVGLIHIVIIALLLNYLVLLIEKSVVKWKID